MDKSDAINHQRRRLFGAAALGMAATQLFQIGSAHAQSGSPPAPKPRDPSKLRIIPPPLCAASADMIRTSRTSTCSGWLAHSAMR